MLLTGAMAYLSAPLWLAFVLVSVGLWLLGDQQPLIAARVLPAQVAPLWLATTLMLVLPRVWACSPS
jgi:membrane glycosyltransferase